MIESLNREIDVDALMLRLRGRVSELEQQGHHELLPGDAIALRNNVFINSLEAFVNTADQKAQVRAQWPSLLGGFFFGSPKIRRVFMDALAFLFKDQRHVNQALVAAFRESISLNRQLIEQVDLLRKDHEDLKNVLGETSQTR
jgi:O-antigen chain-terminating methyltransferase